MVVGNTRRQEDQCVRTELTLQVLELTPLRIVATEEQRVDLAGVEVEDMVGVDRCVGLMRCDVGVDLVDNLPGESITRSLGEQ